MDNLPTSPISPCPPPFASTSFKTGELCLFVPYRYAKRVPGLHRRIEECTARLFIEELPTVLCKMTLLPSWIHLRAPRSLSISGCDTLPAARACCRGRPTRRCGLHTNKGASEVGFPMLWYPKTLRQTHGPHGWRLERYSARAFACALTLVGYRLLRLW